jgi:hypothetical protein
MLVVPPAVTSAINAQDSCDSPSRRSRLKLLYQLRDALSLLGRHAQGIELDAAEERVDIIEAGSDLTPSIVLKQPFKMDADAIERVARDMNAFAQGPIDFGRVAGLRKQRFSSIQRTSSVPHGDQKCERHPRSVERGGRSRDSRAQIGVLIELKLLAEPICRHGPGRCGRNLPFLNSGLSPTTAEAEGCTSQDWGYGKAIPEPRSQGFCIHWGESYFVS